MAAVKGKNGRRPNIHLFQEPKAGDCPPSTCCSSGSSGFVGGFSDWVGSFNSPSPFQRQEHDSTIPLAFYLSAQVASNCLEFIFMWPQRSNKEKQLTGQNQWDIDFMAQQTLIYICELKGAPKTFKELAWFLGGADKAWLEGSAFPRPGSAVSVQWHGHSRETDPRSIETDFVIKTKHGWQELTATDC